MQLLVHESDRVYQDRLINEVDRDKYRALTKEIVRKIIEKDMDPDPKRENEKKVEIQKVELNIAEIYPEDQPKNDKDTKLNIFCNFAGGRDDPTIYSQITSKNALSNVLQSCLADHNSERAEMKLVLFQDAMEHVCRIARIISTSDALLVGVGGSGK